MAFMVDDEEEEGQSLADIASADSLPLPSMPNMAPAPVQPPGSAEGRFTLSALLGFG